jgi:integrase/recombinase XerD
MLERCFVRPTTVDRLRSSWLGEPLDRYVGWLTKEGYAARNVYHRVPIVIQFGAFATARGVHTIAELPAQVDDFVEYWISRHDHRRQIKPTRETLRKEIRGPVEQFLRVAIPGFQGRGRARRRLTLQYLREERGLRDATLDGYSHHLLRFEEYLRSIQLDALSGLSPVVLSSFITDTSHGLSKKSIGDRCGILRVFLRYLYRERVPCARSERRR